MATPDQKYLDESLYPSAAFTSKGNIIPVILIDENGDPYVPGGGGGGVWGSITGTPSDQTDLQNGTIQGGTFTPSNSAIVLNDSFRTIAEKTQGQFNSLSSNYWALAGNTMSSNSILGGSGNFNISFQTNGSTRGTLYGQGRWDFDPTFTADANNRYSVGLFGTITARSTAGDDIYGTRIQPTIIAAADNQKLTALRLRPTLTPGAFAGVESNYLVVETSGGSNIGRWSLISSDIRYGFGDALTTSDLLGKITLKSNSGGNALYIINNASSVLQITDNNGRYVFNDTSIDSTSTFLFKSRQTTSSDSIVRITDNSGVNKLRLLNSGVLHLGNGSLTANSYQSLAITDTLTSDGSNTNLLGLDLRGLVLANGNAAGTGVFSVTHASATFQGSVGSAQYGYRNVTNINNTAGNTLANGYGYANELNVNTNITLTDYAGFVSRVSASTGTFTALKLYEARLDALNIATSTYAYYVGDISTGTQSNVPYGFFNTDANSFNAFNQDTVIGSSNATNPVPLARLQLIGKNSSSEILRGTSSGASTRFIADDNGRWAFNNGILTTATMVVRSVQSTATDSIFDVRTGSDSYFRVLHSGTVEINAPASAAQKLVITNGNEIAQSDTTNFLILTMGTKRFIRAAISASEAAVAYGGTNSYVGSAWHEFKSPNNGRSTMAWYNSSNELMGESWWSGSLGYQSVWDRGTSTEARWTAHGIGKHIGAGDFNVYNNVSGADLYLTVTGGGRVLTGGGKTIFAQCTTSYASMNLAQGTAPTTPADGDFYNTSTSIFARHGGVTYDLLNPTVNDTFDVVMFLTGAATTNDMFDLAGVDALAGRSWYTVNDSLTLVGVSLSIHGPFQTNNTTSSFSVGIREFDLDGSATSEIISSSGTEITSVSQTVTVNTFGANRYRYATAKSTVSVTVNGSTTPKGLMAVVKSNSLASNSNVYLKLTFKR